MTDPPPRGTLRIVTPKLKAALLAGVVAAVAAGLQTCGGALLAPSPPIQIPAAGLADAGAE